MLKDKFYFRVFDNKDDSYFIFMEAEAYSEQVAKEDLKKSFGENMFISPVTKDEADRYSGYL